MQIRLASVLVDNQENALRYYTTILGFVKHDIPMGQFRWLAVSSPEGAEGVELVLEPMGFPPAETYQKALFAAGIPATAFMTKDITSEHRRLKGLGVRFRGEPKSRGPITAVLLEDPCGNLVNLVQPPASLRTKVELIRRAGENGGFPAAEGSACELVRGFPRS
jgi:catechol 2,3-dioxygenase-like lactoylglutathione lyase family enzyme